MPVISAVIIGEALCYYMYYCVHTRCLESYYYLGKDIIDEIKYNRYSRTATS